MATACAINGAAHPAPPTAALFLTSLPRCAYTTTLVRDGFSLVDWGTHVERLRRSIRALNAATEIYAAFFSWLEATPALGEAQAIERLVLPTVLACLESLHTLTTAANSSSAGGEAMLVVALPPAVPAGNAAAATPAAPLAVHAFAAPYERPAPGAGVHVVLAPSEPRAIPEAKDSAWVVGRAPFERLKPPGAAEVVLCTPQGRLLEGLLTNIFVVAEEAGGECVVLTAPARGVVWGTMRQRVIDACASLGVPLREEAPCLASRHTWREAFLTNSVRVIQPVEKISWEGKSHLSQPDGAPEGWVLDLPLRPGGLAARLREQVLGAATWCDVRGLF